MQSTVIARAHVTGCHKWPKAPAAVAYLRHRHRHVFFVLAGFRVSHDDRDVEYHTAAAEIRAVLAASYPVGELGVIEFGSSSCEQIARVVFCGLQRTPQFVEVWEDGENGSRVEEDVAR